MIISHKYKFIFIKTGKVGGTSVEMALSKFLGPEDIITPISWVDERNRFRWGFRTAQNFEESFSSLSPIKWPRWLRANSLSRFGSEERKLRERYRFPRRFWNHMPAAAIRDKIDKETWNRYYKFSIERNPWDKMISIYYWDPGNKRPNMSFRDFVLSGQGLKSNFGLYSINGVVAVDRILRYDCLTQELSEVANQLGINDRIRDTLTMMSAKKKHRSHRSVEDFYDAETRKIVDIFFGREIRLMQFNFQEDQKER